MSTLSLTEAQTLTALRAFLVAVLPAGVEVVKGQDNKVAEPTGPDFVVMTPILQERLSTNIVTFVDGFLTNPKTPTIRGDLAKVAVTIQIDVHGPLASDNARMIETMLRSDWGVDQFAASSPDVAPLYASSPKQIPFLNAEQQIETRWTMDAVLECNPIVTNPQDFAGALEVEVVEVDATYPP
jgi:hypothetical protein